MNNKEHYTPPLCEVITLETIGMLAMSGEVSDTNDNYEFGERFANERRGTWGNLWE